MNTKTLDRDQLTLYMLSWWLESHQSLPAFPELSCLSGRVQVFVTPPPGSRNLLLAIDLILPYQYPLKAGILPPPSRIARKNVENTGKECGGGCFHSTYLALWTC